VSDQLAARIASAAGERVVRIERLSGGDINDAYAAQLASGAKLFVKTRDEVPAGMYLREAEGLAWLAEAGALRVPQVVAATEQLLLLEWVGPGARARDYDQRLGCGLAALHRFGAPCFGHARDNFIGSLPQQNDSAASWAEFFRARRLQPLMERAGALLPRALRGELDALLARMEQLVGPDEPPARLHGDLWSGNVHTDEHGQPALIDPAVYGGHREVDLAMLRLFGAPSARFFAAYDEVYPRAAGHEARVPLYQLYPLLVHVCLFGASYVSQLARAVQACVRA
jgi:fructosamine-3-kinase